MVPLRLVSVNNFTDLPSTVPQFCSCNRVIGVSLVLAQPASNISAAASAQLFVKRESFEPVELFIGAAVLPGKRATVQCEFAALRCQGKHPLHSPSGWIRPHGSA